MEATKIGRFNILTASEPAGAAPAKSCGPTGLE